MQETVGESRAGKRERRNDNEKKREIGLKGAQAGKKVWESI